MGSAAKKIFSVEDWLNLPDEERCELIEGEIYYKAMPSFEHGEIQSRLSVSLGSLLKKGGGNPPSGWWFSTEVAVIYEGRPNAFIHDIAGWRRDRHEEKPKGRKVTIKPDWVCEILSGNRYNDKVTKRNVLHEKRVEYYWIVDLEDKLITVYEWSEKGYITIDDATIGEKKILQPFDSIELDISFLFGQDE